MCVLFFLNTFRNRQQVKRLHWRAFSLAVAREEEFSLAVVEQAPQQQMIQTKYKTESLQTRYVYKTKYKT